MLFDYLPRPIQRGIDLFFICLLIALCVALVSLTPDDTAQAERTMQLRQQAAEETGLNCVQVILAEPGRIDCYDDSGRNVLTHTDAGGWVQQ